MSRYHHDLTELLGHQTYLAQALIREKGRHIETGSCFDFFEYLELRQYCGICEHYTLDRGSTIF